MFGLLAGAVMKSMFTRKASATGDTARRAEAKPPMGCALEPRFMLDAVGGATADPAAGPAAEPAAGSHGEDSAAKIGNAASAAHSKVRTR